MNAKKCKAIRKALRAKGIDVTERTYNVGNPPQFAMQYETVDGMRVDSGFAKVAPGVPTVLGSCGRDTYRGMKRAA